jgi:hypothetical protein
MPKTPTPRLKGDNVFSPCQYDPTESDHIHLANGVADDSESILSHLTIGGDVIWRVDVAIIDLISRNKLVDLNGPRALDFDSLKLFVFNDEVLSFSDLIAARSRRRTSRVHKGSQASPLTMQRFYLIMPIQVGRNFRK